MLLLEIAKWFVLRASYIADKIAPYFGWEMRYDSAYDCLDWLVHYMHNTGVFVWDREIINNRVIFKRKKLTMKHYIPAAGLILILLIHIKLVVEERFDLNMTYFEMSQLVIIVAVAIFGILIIIKTINCLSLLEYFHIAHLEADIAMLKLNLRVNYRLIIIPTIIIQTAGYQFLAGLLILIVVKLYETHSLVHIFFYVSSTYISSMYIVLFMYQYGGHPYICIIRLAELNSFIEKEIQAIDSDAILDDFLHNIDDDDWKLPNHRTSSLDMQAVADILSRHCQIMNAHNSFTSSLLLVLFHGFTVMIAVLVYLYIQEQITILLIIWAISFTFSVMIFTSGVCEIYKRQTRHTLDLIVEWNACYFDPESIYARNSILLQATHEVHPSVIVDTFPMDNNLIIVIIEMIISLVNFLIQSTN